MPSIIRQVSGVLLFYLALRRCFDLLAHLHLHLVGWCLITSLFCWLFQKPRWSGLFSFDFFFFLLGHIPDAILGIFDPHFGPSVSFGAASAVGNVLICRLCGSVSFLGGCHDFLSVVLYRVS